MREITIVKVLNGLVVRVGCQTLVFNTNEEFLQELKAYLDNPAETEQRFLTKYGQDKSSFAVGAEPQYAQQEQAPTPAPPGYYPLVCGAGASIRGGR